MKRLAYLALIHVCSLGCLAIDTPRATDGGSGTDQKCPPLPDLATPKVQCAAAKGLSGVPLICNDFPSAQTLAELRDMGWDFTSKCPAGWTVSNAKLQVSNFSGFADSCIFTTRALTPSEFQKYSSFTLAVVQTVDLTAKQGAYVYLGLDVPQQQIWYTTGSYPQTVTTLKIDKNLLPNGINSYQPLFKITSSLAGGATGWQIDSVAVMGNL